MCLQLLECWSNMHQFIFIKKKFIDFPLGQQKKNCPNTNTNFPGDGFLNQLINDSLLP